MFYKVWSSGEKHNLFKYGNLRFDEKYNKWIFQYQENYKAKGKKWSVNKYGYENAKKLAELFRIKLYSNAKEKYNYHHDVTYDDFYKQIINEINQKKHIEEENKPLFPEFGYLSKLYIKKKNYNAYVLSWTDPNNSKENHCKYFNIDKYGDNNAKILAELFRKQIFPNYNIDKNFINFNYDNYLEILENDIDEKKKNLSKMKFISLYKQTSKKTNTINNYVINWINNDNINISKSFNVNKYGSEENAYKLVLLFRKSLFPEFNDDLIKNINYSFEEYENIILNNIAKKIDYGNIYKINRPAKNSNEDNFVWLYKWKDSETNQFKTKTFTVSIYGDDNAKLLAQLYQKKLFPEYSSTYNTNYDDFIKTFKIKK